MAKQKTNELERMLSKGEVTEQELERERDTRKFATYFFFLLSFNSVKLCITVSRKVYNERLTDSVTRVQVG